MEPRTALQVDKCLVTAEPLPASLRQSLVDDYGISVGNAYATAELGFLALNTTGGLPMQLLPEPIIQVVDPETGQSVGPGEAGEVVVTHLATADFPFIRYRTGDVASLDDAVCACGRGLPLLKEIHGRTTDFIIAADGTVMHGLALIYVVRDVPGVANFKIIQEDRLRTRVQLVTGAGFADESLAAIRAGMTQRLGEGVEVMVEQVADIPRERSGKHRYVVSRVAPSAQ